MAGFQLNSERQGAVMKIKIIEGFKFAHRGIDVVEYSPGPDAVETDAIVGAPENKDAARKRSTKNAEA